MRWNTNSEPLSDYGQAHLLRKKKGEKLDCGSHSQCEVRGKLMLIRKLDQLFPVLGVIIC